MHQILKWYRIVEKSRTMPFHQTFENYYCLSILNAWNGIEKENIVCCSISLLSYAILSLFSVQYNFF